MALAWAAVGEVRAAGHAIVALTVGIVIRAQVLFTDLVSFGRMCVMLRLVFVIRP